MPIYYRGGAVVRAPASDSEVVACHFTGLLMPHKVMGGQGLLLCPEILCMCDCFCEYKCKIHYSESSGGSRNSYNDTGPASIL